MAAGLRIAASAIVGFAFLGACAAFGGDGETTTSTDPPDGSATTDGSVTPDVDAGGSAPDASADANTPTDALFVFVTSLGHDGYFGDANGGPAGADIWCKQLADGTTASATVDLRNRKWRAWLSTADTGARGRAGPQALPYRLRDGTGTLIFPAGLPFGADGSSDLTPQHAINVDEHGKSANDLPVWTGTTPTGNPWTGAASAFCNNWESNADDAGIGGLSGSTGAGLGAWTQSNVTSTCAPMYRVYCFEIP